MDLKVDLKQELKIFKNVKKIRNNFVHNSWDFAKGTLNFKLNDTISMISNVLKRVENIYMEMGL